jgi:HAD superfamily hydrolase (TIGR01549 family)
MPVKAIAFDLTRVLIKRKDIFLSPLELILSKSFDYKVGDELYWDWAVKQTKKNLIETKNICWKTINKIYEINEPDLFTKIPKLRYLAASNHLSIIKDWLKKRNYFDYFSDIVISEDIGFQKPDINFYKILINRSGENPDEILFIDDKIENIQGAKKANLQTLLYNGERLLSEEINSFFKNYDEK